MSANKRSSAYRGWGVVFACFLMALASWGFGFYGHGIFLVELQKAHGWSATLTSSASTAYYFVSAILVVYVNSAIVATGPKTVALVGVICMLVSAVAVPWVVEPWQLLLVYTVMAIGWAATTIAAISNILSLWFRERLGLAVSLALNGASAGGIVVLPILVFLTASMGFSSAMAIGTLFAALVLLPAVLFWVGKPNTSRVDENGKTTVEEKSALTRKQALSSFRFWTIAGPFALILLVQVGFLVHQLALLEVRVGREQAGIIVAVTTGMAILGRVVVGIVIDRLDQRLVSAVSMVSQALALAIIALTNDNLVLLAACALFGASVGNMITFPSLVIRKEFDLLDFGMLTGLATAIGQITYAFGPMMLGALRDFYGDYRSPLLICTVLQVAAGIVVMLRGKERKSTGLPKT